MYFEISGLVSDRGRARTWPNRLEITPMWLTKHLAGQSMYDRNLERDNTTGLVPRLQCPFLEKHKTQAFP